MKVELQKLPYEYNSLEPYIDEQTMRLHHDKHHQTYTDKLNAALEKHPELQFESVEELLINLQKVPEDIKNAVRNHGGGFVNHNIFWKIMKKETKLDGEIKDAIEKRFGSFEKFKEEFANAAVGLFGSGWAWLVVNNGELEIVTTSNQDSPLSQGKIPILTIDVWEHAYYLDYQNRRAEFVENFFHVINWEKVNENFISALDK
jgi:Fe-Mn family superoxide dismutase